MCACVQVLCDHAGVCALDGLAQAGHHRMQLLLQVVMRVCARERECVCIYIYMWADVCVSVRACLQVLCDHAHGRRDVYAECGCE